MKKKIFSSFLAVFLALNISVSVAADPLSDARSKLNQQQNQFQNIDDAYDANQMNVDKLEQIVENLDNDISVLSGKVSDTNNKINTKEKDIANSQKQIDKLIKEIDQKQALLDTRVRAMYINGDDSYLSFLLDSDGLSDFISRIEFVKKIVSFDKGIIEDLNSSRKQIEDKKKALEKEKANLVALKAELEKDKAAVLAKKQAQQKNLDILQSRQDELAENRADYKRKIEASKKMIEDLIRAQQQGSSPSRGIYKNGIDIVAYASRFLGTPYVWGANGPNSFDCSGFTRYVFAHFGISLPRTTYTQVNVGRFVPKSQLQPGDLVFFGNAGNVHHVGIYCGNDTYIHAPHTGDVVKYSLLSYSNDYYTARRVY